MKTPVLGRLLTTLILVAAVILGAAAQASALGLPCAGFHNALERALIAERDRNEPKATECWEKVRQHGETLLAAEPENISYLMGTARAYYFQGDGRHAAQLWETALEVLRKKGVPDPQDAYPWIYVYLGLCYAWLNEPAKAAEYWRQVPVSIGSVYTTIQEQLPALEAAGAAKEAK